MYDLIIKNANIIDGSGAQPYRSDVAILNGKISKIDADITDSAKEVIDASALTLTPGFIDSHSHSDNAMFEFPEMTEKIEQDITLSVAGQCGNSFAPVAKNSKAYHPRLRGTFPRVLGRYVREQKVIPLTEAIRKATSMPAEIYGFENKGLIREGYDADICIFDADTIIDKAEYVNCHERCEGLSYVILGGEVVVKDAVFCGNEKGRIYPL